MQIVGNELARDLPSKGHAPERLEVKIACKQASYTDHLTTSCQGVGFFACLGKACKACFRAIMRPVRSSLVPRKPRSASGRERQRVDPDLESCPPVRQAQDPERVEGLALAATSKRFLHARGIPGFPDRAAWIAIILGLSCIIFLATGCRRRETPAQAGIREQVLHLGNGSEPRDLDPHIVVSYNDFNIVVALFEGLTGIDEVTSQPIPAAAERWETSSDGLIWRFHLRSGARWSNGDPLTAHDFVFGIHRALSPRLASEYAYVLFPIRNAEAFNAGQLVDFSQVGVRAPDNQTLEINLARPAPFLAAAATLPAWFPAHQASIEKLGQFDDRAVPWTRPENMVCNGPFFLKEWSPGNRVVVDRNPDYWDARQVRLNRIVFYPIENASTQEAAFRSGQLHVTSDVPLSRIAFYRQNQPAILRIDPFLDTAFLRFNTGRKPFTDPRVRQALARAFDRTALVHEVTLGGQQPAHCLTPPGLPGYTARAAIPDDFPAARRLLAEAGYPDGRGFPPVEIQFATLELNQRLLEAVQQMWRRELGITVTLANKEQRVWLSDERLRDYDLSYAHWIGDYVDPSTYLELFTSDSGNNSTGWSSPEYDRLIATAGSTLDPSRRAGLYQQAEALLLNEAPIAPIFFGTRVYLRHPAVRNWRPALLGLHQYKDVYLARRATD
jgi:oligopeptide transport system substrate-binding protein